MANQQTPQGFPNENLDSQQDAEQRAREWVVLLDSAEATDSDQQRFKQWLALDEKHRSAFQQVNAIWQATAAMESLKSLEPRTLNKTNTSIWSRIQQPLATGAPKMQWAAALAFAVVVGAVLLTQPTMEVPQTQQYQTATAEKRTLNLADGSEITLSPKTHIEVSYTDQQRHIQLHSGEAFFVVARNPQRPFIVDSRYTKVKVLGTLFNVNAHTFNTTVSVAEGKVQVTSVAIAGHRDKQTRLKAGQQVSVSKVKGLGNTQEIAAENAGSWRRGVRVYEAQPLDQVLQDLGRYHAAELIITDQTLGSQPVTAVFPTDNVGQILSSLESVLPVQVIEINPNRIEIRPR